MVRSSLPDIKISSTTTRRAVNPRAEERYGERSRSQLHSAESQKVKVKSESDQHEELVSNHK